MALLWSVLEIERIIGLTNGFQILNQRGLFAQEYYFNISISSYLFSYDQRIKTADFYQISLGLIVKIKRMPMRPMAGNNFISSYNGN